MIHVLIPIDFHCYWLTVTELLSRLCCRLYLNLDNVLLMIGDKRWVAVVWWHFNMKLWRMQWCIWCDPCDVIRANCLLIAAIASCSNLLLAKAGGGALSSGRLLASRAARIDDESAAATAAKRKRPTTSRQTVTHFSPTQPDMLSHIQPHIQWNKMVFLSSATLVSHHSLFHWWHYMATDQVWLGSAEEGLGRLPGQGELRDGTYAPVRSGCGRLRWKHRIGCSVDHLQAISGVRMRSNFLFSM